MKVLRWIWALVPVLSLGTLSWLAFGFLAARRRSGPLAAAALAYLAVFAFMIAAQAPAGPVAMLLLWGASSFHALWLVNGKRRVSPAPAFLPQAVVPAVHQWEPAPSLPPRQGTPDRLLAEIRDGVFRFNAAPPDRRIDQDVWNGLHKVVLDSWTALNLAHQKGITGDQLIAVEMMYGDYVPSSVRAVTTLRPEQLVTADDAVRVNQSAREIVDSIRSELTAMMRAVSSGDLSHLDEQRAFLKSRFGQSGSIRL